MALTAADLAELARELAPFVCGARVLEAHGLPPADLLLVLEREVDGRRLRLLLSADPDFGRVHLQIRARELHRGPLGPFFRAAIQALAGAELRSLETIRSDRLLRLAFTEEAGTRGELVLELVGRHANAILLDGSGRVRAVLVTPAETSASAARLAPGNPWQAPAGGKLPRSATSFFASTPREELAGPPLALEAPLSWRVENALANAAVARQATAARDDLIGRLEKRLRNAEHQLAGLATRARECEEAERVRQDGELLLSFLAQVPRGASGIELDDLFAPGTRRRLVLDPKRSPQKNAAVFFERAKKLERTRARLPAEIQLAIDQRDRLLELLARARDPAEDLAALEVSAEDMGLLAPRPPSRERSKREPVAPRLPYKCFRALRGGEIRVGRSAKDNDRLTFREARGNDVWLHTADSPGSHVVLRMEQRGEPDPEELLDAAHLAAHFSPLRGHTRVSISVCRAKDVRKPKHAPPGLVTLSAGRTLALRIEKPRLDRLLDPRRGALESEA